MASSRMTDSCRTQITGRYWALQLTGYPWSTSAATLVTDRLSEVTQWEENRTGGRQGLVRGRAQVHVPVGEEGRGSY